MPGHIKAAGSYWSLCSSVLSCRPCLCVLLASCFVFGSVLYQCEPSVAFTEWEGMLDWGELWRILASPVSWSGRVSSFEVVPRRKINAISYALHTGPAWQVCHSACNRSHSNDSSPLPNLETGRSFLAGALVRIDQVEARYSFTGQMLPFNRIQCSWSCE